jgi:hypothetical protein
MSDISLLLLSNSCSLASAFFLNPSVIKNAEEPITADKASASLYFRANATIVAKIIETKA